MMGNRRLLLLALSAWPGLLLAAETAPPVIRPIDECSADKGFAAFLRRFDAAVASRNAQALLQLVSPKVSVGFDGSDGLGAFKREWKLAAGAKSPIWSELKEMRSLGCARQSAEVMVMPRLAERLPEAESFPGPHAPVRAAVALRSGPSAAAPVSAQLHWDVVYPEPVEKPGDWLKVRTAAGAQGFVRAADVRSDMDLRLYFGRVGGRWMVTHLVAGD